MRKLEERRERKLQRVLCNRCGKDLRVENGILKEGCLSVDYCFGYFSKKDGTKIRFDLCEECYEEITSRFAIPVEISEDTELLGV